MLLSLHCQGWTSRGGLPRRSIPMSSPGSHPTSVTWSRSWRSIGVMALACVWSHAQITGSSAIRAVVHRSSKCSAAQIYRCHRRTTNLNTRAVALSHAALQGVLSTDTGSYYLAACLPPNKPTHQNSRPWTAPSHTPKPRAAPCLKAAWHCTWPCRLAGDPRTRNPMF